MVTTTSDRLKRHVPRDEEGPATDTSVKTALQKHPRGKTAARHSYKLARSALKETHKPDNTLHLLRKERRQR